MKTIVKVCLGICSIVYAISVVYAGGTLALKPFDRGRDSQSQRGSGTPTLPPFDHGRDGQAGTDQTDQDQSDTDQSDTEQGVPLRDQNDPENGVVGSAACGPTALGMALEYFGIDVSTQQLIEDCKLDPEIGATIKQIIDAANEYLPKSHFSWGTAFGKDPMTYLKDKIANGGLAIVPIEGKYGDGKEAVGSGHYLLITDVKDGNIYANDPSGGSRVVISENDFENLWVGKEGADSKNKPCVIIRK